MKKNLIGIDNIIMKESYLIVIPARGGSKRLRKKNIRLFNGKPLIAWTIELALKLPGENNVLVSTEDEAIAKIAKQYGANVPFLRPNNLAKDSVSALEVMKHITLKLSFKGIIILLQPTSPLRNKEDIKTGLQLIKKKNNAVMSIKKYIHSSNITTYSKSGEKFLPITKDNRKLFVPNGAVYIANSKWLKENTSFYSEDVSVFEMPQNRSIDIDFEYQFLTAENIFKEINNKK